MEDDSDSSDLELSTHRRKQPTMGTVVSSSDENDDYASTSTGSISGVPAKKRRTAAKCEEDAVPLPNPFPLSKFYGAEVDAALSAKKMTNVTRQAFIAKVASSMLFHKRYPTSDDYTNVGHTIIQKYPFMKSPAGSPAVSYFVIVLVILGHTLCCESGCYILPLVGSHHNVPEKLF